MSESKFLHAYRLDGHGSAATLADDADPVNVDGDEVLWFHFDVNHRPAQDWLMERSSLGEIATDALTVAETRPRAFGDDKGLFVVLRGVNMNPGGDPEDMVSIRVWLEPHRIVSSRRRKLLAVQDIADDLGKGAGPKSSADFLVTLVEKLADRIGTFVSGIEDRIGEAEEAVTTANADTFREELSELRRQMATVRRFLAPQRDALDRLYRQPMSWMSNNDSHRLREESDRFTRYLEDLDLARERAIVLQEEFLNQLAQEQNTRMYVLSIAAVIFLPLTFVTGLLGMNVGGLPGLESEQGFNIALISMLVASGGTIAYLKWKGWI